MFANRFLAPVEIALIWLGGFVHSHLHSVCTYKGSPVEANMREAQRDQWHDVRFRGHCQREPAAKQGCYCDSRRRIG